LNCGTFGPTPSVVAEEAVRLARLIEHKGPYDRDVNDEVLTLFEDSRKGFGDYIGASSDEIALTRNVSDGINIVATGFDWLPGDEVIITNEEHPSGSLPFMNLSERYGVKVNLLKFQTEPTQLLKDLESLVTDKTRLVFLSHVSTVDGARLPAREVGDFLKARDIPYMLDGAHAVGQFPVSMKELGCDFYAGCGHKWLLCQQGTGFLYVKKDWITKLKTSWVGWGMTEEYDLDSLSYTSLKTAQRFEFGTRYWATHASGIKALEFHNNIGPENIYGRSHDLASQLKRRLIDIPGISIKTPMAKTDSTGIVAFSTAGLNHPEPGNWLWNEHRILTAHNPETQSMRIAAAFYLLEDEIDLLADKLSELAS
jgi:selenocysteine lyase/cysteine desulfurase